MQPEQQSLEDWTDGKLVIQKILKPGCPAPRNWKWRVSLATQPAPVRAVAEVELWGLHGGNMTRRVWTMEQIDEEMAAWLDEVVGLDPEETARQRHAIEVLWVLFKGAQPTDLSYGVQGASLRGDTVGRFMHWVDLYKMTHRQRAPSRNAPLVTLESWDVDILHATDAAGRMTLRDDEEGDDRQ